MAVRIDAGVRLRELERAALRAPAADETERHRPVPVERGEAGVPVDLGTQPVLERHEIVDAEVAVVVVILVPALEMAAGPLFGASRRKRPGGLEHERVASLTESDDQDSCPRRRGFEHMREHDQRMGGSRLSAGALKIVAQAVFREAELPDEHRSGPSHRRGEAEVVDCSGDDAGRGQRAAHRLGDDLHVPLVPHPALLPDVVEGLVLSSKVIDEVGGVRGVPQKLRGPVALSDEQRRGRVAGGELERGRSPGPAFLAARDEHRTAAVRRHPARRNQRRGPRPLRACDVQGSDGSGKMQRLGDAPGILAILEGQGGGGEDDLGDPFAAAPRETVPRRLDRHGDGILVPARDSALAASERPQGGIEPGVGLGDGSTLQALPRYVAAECVDAGVHSVRARASVQAAA